jgi:predicted dehydrogenase
MIRAAVIGLNQGFNHCRGYSKAKNALLVAVSDLVETRLEKTVQEFPGIDTYKNYKEMIKRNDLDVVSITVPSFLHTQIALDVIESGKNILIEKPLALTLEDCDKIIHKAKKRGVKVGVQFNKRFHPLFKDIKDLIEKGEIGQIAAISATYWRFPFGVTSKPGQWSGKRKYAGSILFEDGIHWLDLIRWFTGEIIKVHSIDNNWVRQEFDFSQTIFMNLEFKNGGIGSFWQTINGFGNRAKMWIIGTKACILATLTYSPKWDIVETLLKVHQKDLKRDRQLNLINTKRYGGIFETYDQSIEAHFKEVANNLSSNKNFPITGEDGKKAVELCLAAEKSAQEKCIITLPLEKTPGLENKKISSKEINQYYDKVTK